MKISCVLCEILAVFHVNARNCVEGFMVIKSDNKNLGKQLDQTSSQVFQVPVLSLSSRMLVTHVHACVHAYTQDFFFF